MKEALTKEQWNYLHQTQTKKIIELILKVLETDRDNELASVKAIKANTIDKCVEYAVEASKVKGFDLCLDKISKLYERAKYKITVKEEE